MPRTAEFGAIALALVTMAMSLNAQSGAGRRTAQKERRLPPVPTAQTAQADTSATAVASRSVAGVPDSSSAREGSKRRLFRRVRSAATEIVRDERVQQAAKLAACTGVLPGASQAMMLSGVCGGAFGVPAAVRGAGAGNSSAQTTEAMRRAGASMPSAAMMSTMERQAAQVEAMMNTAMQGMAASMAPGQTRMADMSPNDTAADAGIDEDFQAIVPADAAGALRRGRLVLGEIPWGSNAPRQQAPLMRTLAQTATMMNALGGTWQVVVAVPVALGGRAEAQMRAMVVTSALIGAGLKRMSDEHETIAPPLAQEGAVARVEIRRP